MLTVSQERDDHYLLTIYSAELKSCSLYIIIIFDVKLIKI